MSKDSKMNQKDTGSKRKWSFTLQVFFSLTLLFTTEFMMLITGYDMQGRLSAPQKRDGGAVSFVEAFDIMAAKGCAYIVIFVLIAVVTIILKTRQQK